MSTVNNKLYLSNIGRILTRDHPVVDKLRTPLHRNGARAFRCEQHTRLRLVEDARRDRRDDSFAVVGEIKCNLSIRSHNRDSPN